MADQYIFCYARCGLGPFEAKDPCYDCHDMACQYHLGYDPEDHVERLLLFYDQEKKSFYATINGERVKVHMVKFNDDGRIVEVYI